MRGGSREAGGRETLAWSSPPSRLRRATSLTEGSFSLCKLYHITLHLHKTSYVTLVRYTKTGIKNGRNPQTGFLPYTIAKEIRRWPEKQQQRRRQSYRPSGCCRRRSGPSSRREPGRRKNQRTEHRRAYGPWSRSGRRKRGLLPRCPGAGYGPCRRRKQRRSTSCRSR